MGEALRVLVVEDSPDDAWQLLRQLRRAGHEPSRQRVETAEALRLALAERSWDTLEKACRNMVVTPQMLSQIGPAPGAGAGGGR